MFYSSKNPEKKKKNSAVSSKMIAAQLFSTWIIIIRIS